MQIAIDVSPPTYNEIIKWMIQNRYTESTNLTKEDGVTFWNRPGSLMTYRVYYPMSDQKAEWCLHDLNYGHPNRTILELWAEIMGVPDLLEHTVGELLTPAE